VTDSPSNPEPPPGGIRRAGPMILIVAAIAVVAIFVLAPRLSKRSAIPPPPGEAADDPQLLRGHELYQRRCAECHGATGVGDGPKAAGLVGPPPGDLTDGQWKYGDDPERVLSVIADGIPGTSMTGLAGSFQDEDLEAVASYVYFLAGESVPEALRDAGTESD